MPSLPPCSSTTTSTRPSLSGSVARAVRARNSGTAGANATRLEVFRKSRRENMDISFLTRAALRGWTRLMQPDFRRAWRVARAKELSARDQVITEDKKPVGRQHDGVVAADSRQSWRGQRATAS